MSPEPFDPDRWREHLSVYLDGEMPPADARRFLGWLEANPSALKDAEEARRVWALLSDEEFEAILSVDPETLASDSSKNR